MAMTTTVRNAECGMRRTSFVGNSARRTPNSACGRGQSAIEYACLTAIVAATLVGMSVYAKRAISGRWRSAADAFGAGRQYEPEPLPPPPAPVVQPPPPPAPEPPQLPPISCPNGGSPPGCGDNGNGPGL